MLNNPGDDLVLNPQFLPMVKRLDECLTYLGEHVSWLNYRGRSKANNGERETSKMLRYIFYDTSNV